MLHLRELDLLRLDALTVHGRRLGDLLDEWQDSERRKRLRERLFTADGVNPDDVIMDPKTASARGLTSTVTFPTGNLAPEGSVIKSTAIDPSVVDADGIYRKTGPARVFLSEREAIAAIKGNHEKPVQAGDILVLIGRGPLGSGMEETYQLTSALRYLPFGKEVALLTDARFSGVSTGACIGHIGPEALAGGAVGRLREGDTIRIEVDTVNLRGSLNLIAPPVSHAEPAGGAASSGAANNGGRMGARTATGAARAMKLYKRPAPPCWPAALCIRNWPATRACLQIRGCGLRCKRSAAARGAAASTIPSGFWRYWQRGKRRWPRRKGQCVLRKLRDDAQYSWIAAIASEAAQLADDFAVAFAHLAAAQPAIGVIGGLVHGLKIGL